LWKNILDFLIDCIWRETVSGEKTWVFRAQCIYLIKKQNKTVILFFNEWAPFFRGTVFPIEFLKIFLEFSRLLHV